MESLSEDSCGLTDSPRVYEVSPTKSRWREVSHDTGLDIGLYSAMGPYSLSWGPYSLLWVLTLCHVDFQNCHGNLYYLLTVEF